MIKNNKGVTLVELLIVIVILGIIAAVAVPAVGNIVENAQKDALTADAITLRNSIRTHCQAASDECEADGVLTSDSSGTFEIDMQGQWAVLFDSDGIAELVVSDGDFEDGDFYGYWNDDLDTGFSPIREDIKTLDDELNGIETITNKTTFDTFVDPLD